MIALATSTPDAASMPSIPGEAFDLIYLCSPNTPTGAAIPIEHRNPAEITQSFGHPTAPPTVDGNTFTWDIDLREPPDVLRAQTEPGTPDDGGDGGFPWLVVAGVVAGLAIIVGMVVLVRRGATTITDPVPPMTVPSGPTVAAPPAAPQPTYDAGLGAWVVDDPVRGRLRHDPVTGQWLPLGPPQA